MSGYWNKGEIILPVSIVFYFLSLWEWWESKYWWRRMFLFILQPGARFLLATINWWSDWNWLIFLIRSNSGLFCSSNNLKILFFCKHLKPWGYLKGFQAIIYLRCSEFSCLSRLVGGGSGSAGGGGGGPSWGIQYVATSDIDQTCRPLVGWEVRPVATLLVHLQQPILNRYCV